MTKVGLIGKQTSVLPDDLLSYETARDALSSYRMEEPYANTLVVETISLGAAVSLLNDLDWFLTRLIRDAIVLEPSVSDTEWLSRAIATQIRNSSLEPNESSEFLKIYGITTDADAPLTLVDPMFTRRIDGSVPDYDLQEVTDTLVIRVTATEFGTT